MRKKNFAKNMTAFHNDCRKRKKGERAMETEKSNTVSAITWSRRSEENINAVNVM
jgi:hypothetical protein